MYTSYLKLCSSGDNGNVSSTERWLICVFAEIISPCPMQYCSNAFVLYKQHCYRKPTPALS